MIKHKTKDSGIALVVVLLLMLVFTVMLLGFYFETTGEQNVAASDRDNTVAFYAAQGALENMSSALEGYFALHASPTPADIASYAGTANAPVIAIYNSVGASAGQNVSFPTYSITNLAIAANPTTDPPTVACTPTATILCSAPQIVPAGSSSYAGLMGILTPFMLTVVADGPNNTEVKMTRQIQVVAVPVFQYGIFSQTDLSFFAGDSFSFGGRVATNGNLFLAEGGSGVTLTLNDKVTAYLSVVREMLSNGYPIVGAAPTAGQVYTNPVDVTESGAGGCPGGACRALGAGEGSVVAGPGSAAYAGWNALSITTYGGYIKSGSTGVKLLNLALALANQPPIGMIQRPAIAESLTGEPGVDRFFNQASVRIMLSDAASQITSLPGVTGTAPLQLTSALNPVTLPVDACHTPIATSPGYTTDHDYMSPSGTTLLGGYIKIEVQTSGGPPAVWQDVTKEVLSTGISSTCLSELMPAATTVAAPSGAGAPGLTTGIYYCYVVTPLFSWGEGTGTEKCDTTKTSAGNTKIAVTWAAYTGATGYKVYRGTTTSSGGTGTYNENGFIDATNCGGVPCTSAASPFTDQGVVAACGAVTCFATASLPTAQSSIAILHLEEAMPGATLTTANVATSTNYIPINIYDPREGEVRDSDTQTTASLNGIMNLVEVDVGHLQKWLGNTLCTASTVPTSCSSGALAVNNGGYLLYISDRRGNCTDTPKSPPVPCSGTNGSDTGEFGNEDIINPTGASSGTGTPNGTMDVAAPGTGSCPATAVACPPPAGGVSCPIEDVDCSGVFETYGASPHPLAIDTTNATAVALFNSMGPGIPPAVNPAFARVLSVGGTLNPNCSTVSIGCVAQKNSVVVFRRAVRLMDGGLGNLPPLNAATLSPCPNAKAPAVYPSLGGFSVATENPVYIWKDYNASSALAAWSPDPAGQCHVPAAVYADSVTLLSDNWSDAESFAYPTASGSRTAVTTPTWFRVAVIAGKNNSFPLPTFTAPATPPQDFGTDGGTHNFLRYIENWSGTDLHYLGALVSFYIARQATGVYKCCSTVYGPPGRVFAYDTDFTSITSLPPATPRFTDVNALSYQQAILATQ